VEARIYGAQLSTPLLSHLGLLGQPNKDINPRFGALGRPLVQDLLRVPQFYNPVKAVIQHGNNPATLNSRFEATTELEEVENQAEHRQRLD